MVEEAGTIEKERAEAWRTYLKSLENYLNQEEKAVDRASELSSTCTDEWCETTEEVIEELCKEKPLRQGCRHALRLVA